MVVRGREFDEIYDLVGIRVLVDILRDCYAVLGAIHARWNPIPGRFKDYIATPKFNLYQSLHTTVIGPQRPRRRDPDPHRGDAPAGRVRRRRALEVQGAGQRDQGIDGAYGDTDMAWLAHISDWQAETADPGEFLDSLRFEIGAKEVYVFTPQGQGDRTAGRRDPGRLRLRGAHRGRAPHDGREGQRAARAAGERRCNSGDVVEVFTSKNPDAGPSQDWLELRQEPAGAQQDPAWFTKERREEAIEQGKDAIAPRDAQAEPAAAEADEPGLLRRGRGRTPLRRCLRALRRGRRGSRLHAVGDREGRRGPAAAKRVRRRPRSRPHEGTSTQLRRTATQACSCAGRRTSW